MHVECVAVQKFAGVLVFLYSNPRKSDSIFFRVSNPPCERGFMKIIILRGKTGMEIIAACFYKKNKRMVENKKVKRCMKKGYCDSNSTQILFFEF